MALLNSTMSNEIELFVALYTDEDITNLIAKLLRERGFNAISARDVGMLQKSDDEQLEYAVERKMTILVYNRDDFLEIDKKMACRSADTLRHLNLRTIFVAPNQ